MLTTLLIGLGGGVVVGVGLILRACATLFRAAGQVDIDVNEPEYVVAARQLVESLELQYEVAADLNQDNVTLSNIHTRLQCARAALQNALEEAASQMSPSVAPSGSAPVQLPLDRRSWAVSSVGKPSRGTDAR